MKFNKNKTKLASIAAASTILTASTVCAIALLIYDNTEVHHDDNNDPLGRDDSYIRYEVSSFIDNSNAVELFCDGHTNNSGVYEWEFNEEKFKQNFYFVFDSALKLTPKFESGLYSYKYKCSYKFDNKKIIIDVVWFQDENQTKYYDQFILELT